MKRTATVALALLLTAAMVCALCGCDMIQQLTGKGDRIVGKWTGTVDFTDAFNASLEESAEEDEDLETLLDSMKAESFQFDMTFTFKEDGTYTASADADSLQAAVDSYRPTLEAGLRQMYENLLNSYGLDMEVDELFAEEGGTFDDMIDEIFEEMNVQDAVEEIESEGKYRLKDGKLFLSDGVDYDIDPEIYDEFERKGDTLILKNPHRKEADPQEESIYPITLTREADA